MLLGGFDTCGTVYYFAPEMLELGKRFDKRIDYWSLGIVLHEMVTGQRPFTGLRPIDIG